jgi:hypothetical protein
MTYLQMIDECQFTISYIAGFFECSHHQVINWPDEYVKPNKNNQQKATLMRDFIAKAPKRIPYHPSYGCATDEQIAALKTLGMGPERDYILKQIEKQTKLRGKIA